MRQRVQTVFIPPTAAAVNVDLRWGKIPPFRMERCESVCVHSLLTWCHRGHDPGSERDCHRVQVALHYTDDGARWVRPTISLLRLGEILFFSSSLLFFSVPPTVGVRPRGAKRLATFSVWFASARRRECKCNH